MIAVSVDPIRNYGPYSFSRDTAAKNMGLSHSCSNDSGGFSVPRQMERHLITEDQLVHNSVIISQFSQESCNRSRAAALFPWVSVVAESVIDMEVDEGASEELDRQMFSVR
jgi:hypothetical protein